MQLKEFSLISPAIESGTVLKALETAIPTETISQAIAVTHSNEERKRALPTHLVICLVIAMSLWSNASMRAVLKNLVDGLSEVWIRVGQYWKVPCKSSITEARQRIGCRVLSHLFYLVVRPCATVQTPGAFLAGLRLMALDGTVFDVPDTVTNARVFGYPATRPGTVAAFPRISFGTVN